VSDKIIYAPEGRAGEYAPLAINIYRGCGHCCAYCYVPPCTHMSRAEFDAGAVPRKGFSIEQLRKEAAQLDAAGVTSQILLSFSTDPYHPGHPDGTVLTRETLIVLREYGLGFCPLTKGGTRALRDIDLYRPTKDAFAVTLTSLSNTFSQKWERNAPLPGDRIAALKTFFEAPSPGYRWSRHCILRPVWRLSKRPTNSSVCTRSAKPITAGRSPKRPTGEPTHCG
jgi:DNA repair photolyase